MSAKTRLFVDIVERAFWTFAESFFGLLIVASVWDSTQAGQSVSILQAVQVAAVSAVPAALAVLKGLAASMIGQQDSAATLPAELG